MTVNSPSGSTLQCARWLWDGMPWNLSKRSPYYSPSSSRMRVICKVQNKWSPDALHRRAGVESFHLPHKFLNQAERQSSVSWCLRKTWWMVSRTICKDLVCPRRRMQRLNSSVEEYGDGKLTEHPANPGSLLLLVCVSFTIIGQPRNSVLIRRV